MQTIIFVVSFENFNFLLSSPSLHHSFYVLTAFTVLNCENNAMANLRAKIKAVDNALVTLSAATCVQLSRPFLLFSLIPSFSLSLFFKDCGRSGIELPTLFLVLHSAQ